jgi:hypothetical protein
MNMADEALLDYMATTGAQSAGVHAGPVNIDGSVWVVVAPFLFLTLLVMLLFGPPYDAEFERRRMREAANRDYLRETEFHHRSYQLRLEFESRELENPIIDEVILSARTPAELVRASQQMGSPQDYNGPDVFQ